jgi:microsomal dipeptidase-like Zn-dependent dipeptidase
MIADLHAHYPMRVVSDVQPDTALERMRRVEVGPRRRDKLRALALRTASTLFSHRNPWTGYRVTVDNMRQGEVGLAFSVLYRPGEELGEQYDAPPAARYFAKLLEDLEDVEAEVQTGHSPDTVRVVHNRAELDGCLDDGAIALVHSVEGGFHLGDTEAEVAANVATLASKGVAYVTVAHLLFREVATNAPALPFLRWDWVYNSLFPQPRDQGLTKRAEAAVRAMVDNKILIDISHMRPQAIQETFRLLREELDPAPDQRIPVIASHGGYRFGGQKYMVDRDTLLELKERDGVVGLIMAQYQLINGIRPFHTRKLDQSLEVICKHIDKIAEITGSYRHIALGTDFDGFIKPTMAGLEDMRDLKELERALRERYRPEDVELMTSGNALRVLRSVWT